MKALKILVISMGLLIVLGIALIGYGLTRSKHPLPAQTQIADVERGTFFEVRYPAPKGMKLEQVGTTGDRIFARYAGPDGERLVLFDTHTGQPAGTIDLTPDGK